MGLLAIAILGSFALGCFYRWYTFMFSALAVIALFVASAVYTVKFSDVSPGDGSGMAIGLGLAFLITGLAAGLFSFVLGVVISYFLRKYW